MRSLKAMVVRVAVVAVLIGAGWLLLQVYTEEEIATAGAEFWQWWSTRLTGDLAQYWNPFGAVATLIVIALFVLQPITRLFRSRGGHSSHSDSHYDDESSTHDDGGADGDD